jgi:hypothetical protein
VTGARCSRCRGELLPEWGSFVTCPTCREAEAKRAAARRATPEGREAHNAARRGCYARNSATENARKNARRAQKQQVGVCVHCTAPAADDSDMCPAHRDQHRASSLAYYHRTKAGAAC